MMWQEGDYFLIQQDGPDEKLIEGCFNLCRIEDLRTLKLYGVDKNRVIRITGITDEEDSGNCFYGLLFEENVRKISKEEALVYQFGL